jgi:hypothetical protein
MPLPRPLASFGNVFLILRKFTFLDLFDMYFIVFVTFSKNLDVFSQCLVTHLVPEVKGLPGGVDLICHAGLDPSGYYYGMQNIELDACVPNCRTSGKPAYIKDAHKEGRPWSGLPPLWEAAEAHLLHGAWLSTGLLVALSSQTWTSMCCSTGCRSKEIRS